MLDAVLLIISTYLPFERPGLNFVFERILSTESLHRPTRLMCDLHVKETLHNTLT
jgi:hypothetical protein